MINKYGVNIHVKYLHFQFECRPVFVRHEAYLGTLGALLGETLSNTGKLTNNKQGTHSMISTIEELLTTNISEQT